MKRPTLLIACLGLLACGRTSDGLTTGTDEQRDMASTASRDASRRGPDLVTPGNPEGGDCNTACDCEPGLACRRGTCSMSDRAPSFCCSSTACPEGETCETASGDESVCGESPTTPDLSSGRRDGGSRDGGSRDGGRPDGGRPDGGPRDGGWGRDGGYSDGGWGRDGGRPDGGPRDAGRPGDGSTGFCKSVLCATDQGCQLIGCGACDRATGYCK